MFAGCSSFSGLKLSADRQVCQRPWGIRHVEVNRRSDCLELFKIGTVGWAGNSGFQALNVAVQFMCRRIILVGFDMTLAAGVHWHGAHPKGMNNPSDGNVRRWRDCLDAAADQLDAAGIDVINASATSALQRYPKMTLMEAFEYHAGDA